MRWPTAAIVRSVTFGRSTSSATAPELVSLGWRLSTIVAPLVRSPSRSHLTARADQPNRSGSSRATAATPKFPAYLILRTAFIAAPILMGVDKFFNWMTFWPKYLWVGFPHFVGVGPQKLWIKYSQSRGHIDTMRVARSHMLLPWDLPTNPFRPRGGRCTVI